MNLRLLFLLLLVFCLGSTNDLEAQIFSRKKKEVKEQPASQEKKKGLFSRKTKQEAASTQKPVKEKVALRKSHSAAKADVRASKKERKAAEAREQAARARAARIKAERHEERAERKVSRKEKTATKSRTKAEKKRRKGLSRFFRQEG